MLFKGPATGSRSFCENIQIYLAFIFVKVLNMYKNGTNLKMWAEMPLG